MGVVLAVGAVVMGVDLVNAVVVVGLVDMATSVHLIGCNEQPGKLLLRNSLEVDHSSLAAVKDSVENTLLKQKKYR